MKEWINIYYYTEFIYLVLFHWTTIFLYYLPQCTGCIIDEYMLYLFILTHSAGWVDVWTTPIAAVSITYMYHPVPLLKGAEVPTGGGIFLHCPAPLAPLRPLRPKKRLTPRTDSSGCDGSLDTDEFYPPSLEPDQITVEIEIGPSVCFAYGSLVRNFLQLKVVHRIWTVVWNEWMNELNELAVP